MNQVITGFETHHQWKDGRGYWGNRTLLNIRCKRRHLPLASDPCVHFFPMFTEREQSSTVNVLAIEVLPLVFLVISQAC